jgi:hypothetical protein
MSPPDGMIGRVMLSFAMKKNFPDAAVLAAAAICLRMSTESQNYSTHHQRAAIAQYAKDNAMIIVREYVDDGKSGLDIKRRLEGSVALSAAKRIF